MLIIAQTKSASRSLLVTIAKILKIKWKTQIMPKKPLDVEGFDEIKKFHTDIIRRGKLFLKTTMTEKHTVYKEHIVPTEEHLNLLSQRKDKYIILLRTVKDCLDSYVRHFAETGEQYDKKKLYNDLKQFNSLYREFAKGKDNILIVDYENLVLNYENEMTKILNHLGFKKFKIIPLEKILYTGIGEKKLLDAQKTLNQMNIKEAQTLKAREKNIEKDEVNNDVCN